MLCLMGKALNDKNNSSVLIPCQEIIIQILMNIFTMLLRKKSSFNIEELSQSIGMLLN